ncbi:cadmium metallothionein-like [Penaeus japonicus]|uniref:cadmium metallothionein-like n=1 Tax=Penaeus japonicus TaxID=27405 RepID=UPI001C711757|nr:cadmium metallothionein-like [Penaeus japonicus]
MSLCARILFLLMDKAFVVTPDCEIKPACSDRGGSCKLTCEDKEIEIPEGCEGENCKCCMPEDNLAVCTTDASTCQGTCVDSLNCDEEVAGSTCNGTNCKCCRDCKPQEVCSNLNGVCKNRPTEECPAGEVVIVDGCTGLDCTCCAGTSGLLSCPASPACPGRCRDARVCPVVMKDTSCTTPGCTCCLDCKDQSCAQNNGVCRERGTCLDGETESTAGECTGNRCVCCKK